MASARERRLDHEVREVDPQGLREELESLPVALSTMGRGLHEDPQAFLYAALAGRAAAQLMS